MKRVFTMLLTGLLGTGLGATQAMAQSPHFVGTQSCPTKSLDTGLTCSGKVAGLGGGLTAAFLQADKVTETFACQNPGNGKVVPGQPIQEQHVLSPTQTITPRNGQITYSVTIPPPDTPSAADICPNANWSVTPISLIYTNVVVHIQQPPGTDVLTHSFGDIDP